MTATSALTKRAKQRHWQSGLVWAQRQGAQTIHGVFFNQSINQRVKQAGR
jgi:hypothetical protein